MTITTPFHHDVRKDEQVDRRVDVQTDGRKAAGKDSGGLSAAGAFVIVLANQLCRIRHRWFCAESLVMPRSVSSRVGCAC
jgi:hypothetical protein